MNLYIFSWLFLYRGIALLIEYRSTFCICTYMLLDIHRYKVLLCMYNLICDNLQYLTLLPKGRDMFTLHQCNNVLYIPGESSLDRYTHP